MLYKFVQKYQFALDDFPLVNAHFQFIHSKVINERQMVSKMWLRIVRCLLPICYMQLLWWKIQGHLQKYRLCECRYIRTHYEEKSSKISNFTSAITTLLSWVFWSRLLHQIIRWYFKIVLSNTKKEQTGICMYLECYLRTTHSSGLKPSNSRYDELV